MRRRGVRLRYWSLTRRSITFFHHPLKENYTMFRLMSQDFGQSFWIMTISFLVYMWTLYIYFNIFLLLYRFSLKPGQVVRQMTETFVKTATIKICLQDSWHIQITPQSGSTGWRPWTPWSKHCWCQQKFLIKSTRSLHRFFPWYISGLLVSRFFYEIVVLDRAAMEEDQHFFKEKSKENKSSHPKMRSKEEEFKIITCKRCPGPWWQNIGYSRHMLFIVFTL